MKFSQALKNYSKVLQSKFDCAKITVTDSSVKGKVNEHIVAEFLKGTVPYWFISTNSQIIDSYDNSSDEMDVCICNKDQFLIQPEGGILIAEGVDCVVQVKAVLTSDDLNRVIKSCIKVKNLKRCIIERSTVYVPAAHPKEWLDFIPYFCFAFSSQLQPNTIVDKLNEKSKEIGLNQQIDFICILDQGISLFNCTTSSPLINKHGHHLQGWIPLKTNEATLLEFVRKCIDGVPRIKYSHPPITNYFPKRPGYKKC